MDFSGEALGSLDTCHHPDEGQIFTTTMPIRQRKGSENGVHMWYTCKCMCTLFILLGMLHVYDIVDIVNNIIIVWCKSTICDQCTLTPRYINHLNYYYYCVIRTRYVIGVYWYHDTWITFIYYYCVIRALYVIGASLIIVCHKSMVCDRRITNYCVPWELDMWSVYH